MTSAVAKPPFDVARVREDFPGLSQDIHGKPLAYLDNAASSQTPKQVVDALDHAYLKERANIHRGVHLLSQKATDAYEGAREKVREFIGAKSARECIFVRGTTEAINLVASTWGRANIKAGDEIVLTELEHHSNIVPWQLLADDVGAKIRVAPIDDTGTVIQREYEALLNEKTKLVGLSHVSNALGTINPIKEMVAAAHNVGAVAVVDGAQAVPHMPVNVVDIDADFYAFSGHKMYGPTGIGVLYGKLNLLEAMPPYQGGGDMILTVSFEGSTFNEVPHKFEAGTPDIAGVVGLGAAVDYLRHIDLAKAAAWEDELLRYATEQVSAIEGLHIIGTAEKKAGVLSFVVDDVHPHDIGTIVDQEGVAIRTGHHCAQPVMDHFKVPATARASFAFYNTYEEVDALVRALNRCIEVLR